jgi:hypothetical protein
MEIILVESRFSFMVWLALLGGIRASMTWYFHIVASAISRKILMNNILQDLFYIKNRQDNDKEMGESQAYDLNSIS